MNYMKQVAEILGVELGEEFKTKCGVDTDVVYRLTETGLEMKFSLGTVWEKFYGDMEKFLTGELVLEKLPWKPEQEETYYFPKTSYGLAHADEAVWCDTPNDRRRYAAGMVCETVCEAQEKAERMLAALKEA